MHPVTMEYLAAARQQDLKSERRSPLVARSSQTRRLTALSERAGLGRLRDALRSRVADASPEPCPAGCV